MTENRSPSRSPPQILLRPSSGLDNECELEELRTALHQLSDEHQTILLLRFVERKSHQEVADILDKEISAISTAQHRALKRLAELLGTEKTSRHYLRGK